MTPFDANFTCARLVSQELLDFSHPGKLFIKSPTLHVSLERGEGSNRRSPGGGSVTEELPEEVAVAPPASVAGLPPLPLAAAAKFPASSSSLSRTADSMESLELSPLFRPSAPAAAELPLLLPIASR